MFDIDIDENKVKFVRSVSYRYSSGRFSQTDFKLNIFYLQVAKHIFISYKLSRLPYRQNIHFLCSFKTNESIYKYMKDIRSDCELSI